MTTFTWRFRDRIIEIGPRALVMGIVNVTPDSFSDGGQFATTELAVEHALHLVAAGADILDVGGESSRPGAEPVSIAEEIGRVIPVIRECARLTTVPISVDTMKAEVARQALAAGAVIVNDITALGDPDLAGIVREAGAGVVLMHMQGTPRTMHLNPTYIDVVAEVGTFLEERLRFAERAGIATECIALDPGIGFGKSNEHSLCLLRNLGSFQRFGRPVCLGVSRKGFIGAIVDRPREQRDIGSVAVACHAIVHGAAQIVRVHDVAAHRDAVRMLAALSPLTSSDLLRNG
jgi:dihydropteroate synthase